ncbi:33087_t:CDS:2, partial [Racocetra persica]
MNNSNLNCIKENEKFYIVREYANGDFRDYIKSHSPISWVKKLELTRQIVSGLRFLHDIKVIHSELHPNNILMHYTIPKLTNIGMSK